MVNVVVFSWVLMLVVIAFILIKRIDDNINK